MPNLLAYDPNAPFSRAVPAAYAVAALLAASSAFKSLLDDPAASASHVHVGEPDDPWNEARYTQDELDNALCMAFVEPSEEVPVTADKPEAASACPDESFDLLIVIRRQVRDAEISQTGGRQGCYLAFWDVCHSLPNELAQALDPDWNFASVTASPRVGWGIPAAKAAQGSHLVCELTVSFGEGGGQ